MCVCVRARAYRKLQVRFNDYIMVHELKDLGEERRSPWMYAAARRLHFQRRIQWTAIILDPILTYRHRMLMKLRTMRLSD